MPKKSMTDDTLHWAWGCVECNVIVQVTSCDEYTRVGENHMRARCPICRTIRAFIKQESFSGKYVSY